MKSKKETTTVETAVESKQTPTMEEIKKAQAILEQSKEVLKAQRAEAKKIREEAEQARLNAPIFKFEQSAKMPILMAVSVSNSLAKGLDIKVAAQGHWRMSEIKAATVKHVVAENRGLILQVYSVISSEFREETPDGPNRYWFELEEDETLTNELKGQLIPKKKGQASPITYIFEGK